MRSNESLTKQEYSGKKLPTCLASHKVVSNTPYHGWKSNSPHIVMIGTGCTGKCKFNYNNITATTTLKFESTFNNNA